MKIISIKYLTIAGLFALSIAGPGCAKIDDFGNINNINTSLQVIQYHLHCQLA